MPALAAAPDLQWPYGCLLRPAAFSTRPDPGRERELYDAIESFFRHRLGGSVTLMPSGRAAIATLLDYLGAGRGSTVFAPRWSSSCVWSAIGRTANPTTSLRTPPDYAIAVHKWGYRSAAAGLGKAVVIEDSIDSVFLNGDDLFALGGRHEVVSLPKIMGAYCGGVVISRDAGFRRYALEQRRKGTRLGRSLSRLKHQRYLGREYGLEALDALELENRALDLNGLRHIAACLPQLERNATTIQRRLQRARAVLGRPAVLPTVGRLPVVLPLRESRYPAAGRAHLQLRHFNFSRRLDRDRFEKCWVLPLHFGVSDRFFDKALAAFPARGR